MQSLVKKSSILVLISVLILSNPCLVKAEESTTDPATEEMISSLIQQKTSDAIVGKIIDDFNGDGEIEAIVATSPDEDAGYDFWTYDLWYVTDNDASEISFDTRENFMCLKSYTLSGQKLISFSFFENHVTTSDFIYLTDTNGFHFLGIFPSMYQDGDYMISSQGRMGDDGWYFEEVKYVLKGYELVPVDDKSNTTETEVSSTNPASPLNWYKEYDYELDQENKTITLLRYLGLNRNVHVKNSATVDGITYTTCIDGKLFEANKTVKNLSFSNGCKVIGPELRFASCINLESINLYGLDISDVTSMDSMFLRCRNLRKVRFGGLDTSNITNMSFFFTGCTSLKNIDLHDLIISNDAYIYDFLLGCDPEELVTPQKLDQDLVVPYYFVIDDNNDGNADSDEKYKIIPKGTESTRFIKYASTSDDYSDSGIDYSCGECQLKKIGDDYYLFPSYAPDHNFWNGRESIVLENYENGIKIAEDAMVGVAVKENIVMGEEDAWGEYYYEYRPFYEEVEALFANKHWTIDEKHNCLYFEIDGRSIVDFPTITLNANGEICLITDYFGS